MTPRTPGPDRRVIALAFAALVAAGCSPRESATHHLWYDKQAVLDITDLEWSAKNRVIADNPDADIRMTPDGKHLYLQPKDKLDTTNAVMKTLATPFTVLIDGVDLTVVGVLSAAGESR